MAARPKASAKNVAAFQRRKALLAELMECPLSVLIIRARGEYAFAQAMAADGLIYLGSDTCSIAADGRKWMAEYG